MSSSSNRRVAFVTGATGFVGLNVVDELLSRGFEVHALHRPGSSRLKLLRSLPNANAHLHLVTGKMGAPPGDFARLVPEETGQHHLAPLVSLAAVLD